MSTYNTQLQSNNADLQEVLQTLQSKTAGSGENITSESIIAALGYTPANEETVSQLSAEIDNLIDKNEPAEDDIPKVFFGSALPQTKDDTIMSFRYISKTKDISGYCKTKAQGSSSMSYPKKNQTVKLYADAECTEKLKVDFKGWGEQNKFCFKANWIDLTHARNIVSARLWGHVVKSRASYADIPELLRTSPNQGAVDGFPVKVYAGGVYQGRYTINIPKDAWMANMDSGLDTHCILCGENYVSGCFRAEALIDGSDWTDEVHETVPAVIKTRWNDAIRFVMNSTDEEFVSGIGNYFDVDSLIDYYLFGLASCGLDAFGKNQLYMTTDGLKWYATMYDMDSTWGLWWDGSYFVPSDYARSEYEDFKNGAGNLLYIRLETLFIEQLRARWAELRRGSLAVDNIINRFERFTDIAPHDLVEEDCADTTASGAFANIPSQNTNNIQQIRAYIVARMLNCDVWVENLGQEATAVLYNAENLTFDGTAGVDTGISLAALDAYTILLDYTASSHDYDSQNADVFLSYQILHWNGWNLRRHRDIWDREVVTIDDSTIIATIVHLSGGSDTWLIGKRLRFAIRKTEDGVYTLFTNDHLPSGLDITEKMSGEAKFSGTLKIGYVTDENGTEYGHINATVHRCTVYGSALIDSEITMFLNGE